jgi:hypothetical protein
MDKSVIDAVLEKLDANNAYVDIQAVLESFGENGQGPSFVRIPFLDSGTECDPLDIEVFLDVGAADGVSVGKTNIANEALEAFSDDPEHYRVKAQAMAAALRALADQLESLACAPKDGLTVHDIGLSPRIANRLEKEGIHLVTDLLQHNEIDLLKLPDVGKTALADIKKAVRPFGGLSEKSIRHDEMMREREEMMRRYRTNAGL